MAHRGELAFIRGPSGLAEMVWDDRWIRPCANRDLLRRNRVCLFPESLAIPAVAPEKMKEVISPANTFFHQLLPIGAFMGVATLPLWTILTGFQLLKKRRPAYA